MRRIVLVCATLILLAVCASPADAWPRRRAVASYQTCSTCTTQTSFSASCANGRCEVSASVSVTTAPAGDALAQLNAQRAARGLRPYQHDPLLAEAAARCAAFRAERRITGHTSNDFAFLQGVTAAAAGCAAWPQGIGFGACEMYAPNYTHAGAAWVVGADGRVYCHLFVR